MKEWMKLAVVLMALGVCVGCGNGLGTKMVPAHGAMVLEDVIAEDGYTATTSSRGEHFWHDLDGIDLDAGDIVLVLEEGEERSRVMIPGGDYPFAYGYIPNHLLTYDPELMKTANQADLVEATTYFGPNGEVKDESWSGLVHVGQRQDGWVEVTPIAGGAESRWVKEESLVFEFGGDCIDRG